MNPDNKSLILEVNTQSAPSAVGPYSQAVSVGGFIFCSGQIGLDPQTGRLVDGGVLKQTEQVIKNLEQVLIEAGTDLSGIVRTEIFVTDMARFSEINEIYSGFFKSKPLPARATVEVSSLPKGAEIEIACIAVLKK